MVTQSKLFISAGPSSQVTVTPAGQLLQMGAGATERGTVFGFDGGFLAFFCGLQCPQRNALVRDIFYQAMTDWGKCLRHGQQIP